jgi:fermentation-respiration switch protein FrsA (DUF1100 family)
VRAIVPVSAPYDIVEHYGYEQIRAVHTLSAMWAATGGHPLAHSAVKLAEALKTFDVEAKSALPKIHVLHGDNDTTVPLYEAQDFYDALRTADVPTTERLVVLEGDHFTTVENLMYGKVAEGPSQRPTLSYLLDLIDQDNAAAAQKPTETEPTPLGAAASTGP